MVKSWFLFLSLKLKDSHTKKRPSALTTRQNKSKDKAKTCPYYTLFASPIIAYITSNNRFPFGQKGSYIQSHLWLMSWFYRLETDTSSNSCWFYFQNMVWHCLLLSISNSPSPDYRCLLPWECRNILSSLASQFPLLSHSFILHKATRVAFYKYKSSHFYHLLRWLSTVWRISKLEHKPSGCEVAPVQMAACTLGHSLPALLDSRLLSQASTHWSKGLGLSSVTSPQLVPIILPISAKCHLLRTSSLTPLSTSTSAFLYSIPIFHHIHFFSFPVFF